jgi:hypothetical protein
MKLLDEKEAAALLRCSPSKIKKLRLSGRLAFIPSRPVMIDEADLLAFIEREKRPARPPESPAPQRSETAPLSADAAALAARRAREAWLKLKFSKRRT